MRAHDPPLPLRTLLAADAARSRALQASRFGYAPHSWWIDPGFVAVLCHRLAHTAHCRGGRKRARLLMQLGSLLTGADFHPAARIGPGLLVPSPFATNLSCCAGAGLTLMGQAGIGGSNARIDIGAGPGLPLLGDTVRAGRFSGINGPFPVGDGAIVVAGAGTVRGAAPGETARPSADPAIRARTPDPSCQPREAPPCAHASLTITLAAWKADLVRYCSAEDRYGARDITTGRLAGAALTNTGIALLTQRLAHWLHRRGWRRAARVPAAINRLVWKLDVPASTCLGGGLVLPHLAGIVVEGRIGADVTLYANTICAGWRAHPGTGPTLGDGVTVGGHSGVFGPVTVGDGVHLSPKVQLATSVPDHATVFSRAAHCRNSIEPTLTEPPVEVPDAYCGQDGKARARDRARIRAFRAAGGRIGFNARLAVRLHRAAHRAYARGRLRQARIAWLANQYLTGADISPASRIGGGLLLPHPAGLVIHGTLGADCTVMAMAGIGADLRVGDQLPPLAAAPILGARVHIDHHGQVDGAVRIGDDARIMPGCTARIDVPAAHEMAIFAPRLRRAEAPKTEARR